MLRKYAYIQQTEHQQTDSFNVEWRLQCRRISLHHGLKSSSSGKAQTAGGRVSGRRRLGSDGLDRQNSSSLLGQLCPRLGVRVEQREVGHDHRNRKCYCQYAGERTQRPDKHPEISLWRHVAVADCRHCYNRPPQSERDGMDLPYLPDPWWRPSSMWNRPICKVTTQDAEVFCRPSGMDVKSLCGLCWVRSA